VETGCVANLGYLKIYLWYWIDPKVRSGGKIAVLGRETTGFDADFFQKYRIEYEEAIGIGYVKSSPAMLFK
jgi:hypothetical protein